MSLFTIIFIKSISYRCYEILKNTVTYMSIYLRTKLQMLRNTERHSYRCYEILRDKVIDATKY